MAGPAHASDPAMTLLGAFLTPFNSSKGEQHVVYFLTRKLETLGVSGAPALTNILSPTCRLSPAAGIPRRALALQHADRHEPAGQRRRISPGCNRHRPKRRHHRLLLRAIELFHAV